MNFRLPLNHRNGLSLSCFSFISIDSLIFSFNLNHEIIIYIWERIVWIHVKIWLNDQSFCVCNHMITAISNNDAIYHNFCSKTYFWLYFWEKKHLRRGSAPRVCLFVPLRTERQQNIIFDSIEWQKNCAVHSCWHLTAEYEMTQTIQFSPMSSMSCMSSVL